MRMKNGIVTLEKGMIASCKAKHTLTHDPAVYSWVLASEINIYLCPKTCIQMFVAALFIVASTENHPNVLQRKNG